MSQALDYTLPEHLAARQSAKRRESGVQIVAALLAVVCFVGAGLFVRPVNKIRRERQLMIDPDTVKGLPPDIALLGKLGTFRALAIDWASIRAERLKEEGKTYEALQLHETVCALAPRFPSVWVNAAWNMAYNISVSQYSPEARWQWVQNGIRILRDKGIQYNPRSVTLYKELAWIYWHKIGDFMDDEHLNYKRALAVEMERALGAPPTALTDEAYSNWFRKIVDAPRDLDELLRTDADVARLVARLREVRLEPDDSLLDFVARHLRPELTVADLVKDRSSLDSLLARRLEVTTDAEQKEPLDRLLAAIRSKVLRERHRFDLDWMYDLMVEQYGPLDWRNAFSHALYWSSWGGKISKGYENVDPADAMNTARFVFIALQHLITKGRITLWPDFDDPFSSYIELTPDTRYIPYLYETYFRLTKEQFGDDPDFEEGEIARNYRTGFITNMHQWVHLLYLEGGEENLAQAEDYYAWLREHNKHPDGSTQERYRKTLDEFVMGELLDQLHTYKAVTALIRSFVRRALKQFSLGLTRAGVTSLVRARQCYEYWQIGTKNDPTERRQFQPPRVILRDEIEAYLKQREVAPLYKARLWKNLPLAQRQMTYDRLALYFKKLCEAQEPPWDVSVAFCEPPGMEAFRETEIETRGAPKREGVEQGERFKD
ncbi:MAG: hypothetical protein WBE26_10080 [Phycisphaerae bacterium]